MGRNNIASPIHTLQVDAVLAEISSLTAHKDYEQAARICERLLSYMPDGAPQRAEVLAYYGMAQAMLENTEVLPEETK